jgi:hypothetical protein
MSRQSQVKCNSHSRHGSDSSERVRARHEDFDLSDEEAIDTLDGPDMAINSQQPKTSSFTNRYPPRISGNSDPPSAKIPNGRVPLLEMGVLSPRDAQGGELGKDLSLIDKIPKPSFERLGSSLQERIMPHGTKLMRMSIPNITGKIPSPESNYPSIEGILAPPTAWVPCQHSSSTASPSATRNITYSRDAKSSTTRTRCYSYFPLETLETLQGQTQIQNPHEQRRWPVAKAGFATFEVGHTIDRTYRRFIAPPRPTGYDSRIYPSRAASSLPNSSSLDPTPDNLTPASTQPATRSSSISPPQSNQTSITSLVSHSDPYLGSPHSSETKAPGSEPASSAAIESNLHEYFCSFSTRDERTRSGILNSHLDDVFSDTQKIDFEDISNAASTPCAEEEGDLVFLPLMTGALPTPVISPKNDHPFHREPEVLQTKVNSVRNPPRASRFKFLFSCSTIDKSGVRTVAVPPLQKRNSTHAEITNLHSSWKKGLKWHWAKVSKKIDMAAKDKTGMGENNGGSCRDKISP